MRADATLEQRVAVQQQVLRGDGGRHVAALAAHELHGRGGGDMLEHDAQAAAGARVSGASTVSMKRVSRSNTSIVVAG